MSEPSPPFYYKDPPHTADPHSEAFHWEVSCSRNHYGDPGWVKTEKKPDRTECEICLKIGRPGS